MHDSPIYFFSNSPVKWRYKDRVDQHTIKGIQDAGIELHTLTKVVLPVPPSPTVSNHIVGRVMDMKPQVGMGKRENGQVAWISIKMEKWKTKFSFSRVEARERPTLYAPRTSLKVGIVCSDM